MVMDAFDLFVGRHNQFERVSPFSDWIVADMISDWCKKNPMPEEFNNDDSWHWSIKGMHELNEQLKGNK